jgi:hypothetical protein
LDKNWTKYVVNTGRRRDESWPVAVTLDPRSKQVSTYNWARVKFPALVAFTAIDEHRRPLDKAMLHRNGFRSELRPIKTPRSYLKLEPISARQPERIAIMESVFDRMVLVYHKLSETRIDSRILASMPDNWDSILAVCSDGAIIINRSHVLTTLATPEKWRELLHVTRGLKDQEALVQISKMDNGIKAAYLIRNADTSTERWNGLRDHSPKAFGRLFEIEALLGNQGQFHIVRDKYEWGVRIIQRRGQNFIRVFPSGDSLHQNQFLSWFLTQVQNGGLNRKSANVSAFQSPTKNPGVSTGVRVSTEGWLA